MDYDTAQTLGAPTFRGMDGYSLRTQMERVCEGVSEQDLDLAFSVRSNIRTRRGGDHACQRLARGFAARLSR